MPVNSIRQKNGNKVYNKNATGRAGLFNPHGSYILRPKRPCHTDKIVRTVHNDGHDNPTRMRHVATRAWHSGYVIAEA